ncbi:hypothetical protein [Streptosporangium saharense]|uniref:hypothetical protein n=1 Tax=Streptosporangium saharense TaxID=1706840 RepID=UPI003690243F
MGTWVEGDDADEIARLLGVEPATAQRCDLGTAMHHHEPYAFTEIVWIGTHAPDWTHVTSISGPPLRTTSLAADGRRLFQVVWDAARDGVHDLSYCDGERMGRLSPLSIAEVPAGSVFDGHTHGLVASRPGTIDMFSSRPTRPTGSLRLWMENWLCLVGRITGQFIDRDWLAETRTLYHVPLGVRRE